MDLFRLLDTQWRVGMGGYYGLDYSALYPLMDRLGVTGDDWLLLFADIRTLESAALAAMHTKT